MSHAEQAWNHRQQVENFAIGRPCTQACKYGRSCGMNISPGLLLAAHNYSYGHCATRREDSQSTTYAVEFKKSETLRRWRQLAAAAMSVSNDGEKRHIERLTVSKVGPVCIDYWAAAYGIPKGTANALLADARSGRLEADVEEGESMRAAIHSQKDNDVAAEMTIQWWELWLELEDQMPNEPAIQHRTVVWQSVYELEYIPDIQWWGICRALSRSRWVQLRTAALRNLSIHYYGHVEGSPDVPCTMLSLVERPAHSNFGMCMKCSAAKEQWMHYRRCECIDLSIWLCAPRRL